MGLLGELHFLGGDSALFRWTAPLIGQSPSHLAIRPWGPMSGAFRSQVFLSVRTALWEGRSGTLCVKEGPAESGEGEGSRRT